MSIQSEPPLPNFHFLDFHHFQVDLCFEFQRFLTSKPSFLSRSEPNFSQLFSIALGGRGAGEGALKAAGNSEQPLGPLFCVSA